MKRELDEGARDEVRIMTVHGAKGLQAPIVILPDTTQLPQARPNLLWLRDGDGDEAGDLLLWSPRTSLDEAVASEARSEHRARQMEEYRRLLYVALTRAEDRLYVCGWQTGQMKTGAGGQLVQPDRGGLRERAATVAFDASALIGDEGWQGEALRLESPQAAAPDKAAEQGAAERAPPPAPPPWITEAPRRGDAGRAAADAVAAGGRGAAGAHAAGRRRWPALQARPDHPPPAGAAARCAAGAARGRGPAVPGAPCMISPPKRRTRSPARCSRVLEHPEFAPLFGPGSQAEVPLVGELAGRDGPFILSGQIDRLVVSPERDSCPGLQDQPAAAGAGGRCSGDLSEADGGLSGGP